MAQKQKICIIVDHRSVTNDPKTREFGGVAKPRHGLKINSKIEQLLIITNIRGVCLRGEDYAALTWAMPLLGGNSESIGVAYTDANVFS